MKTPILDSLVEEQKAVNEAAENLLRHVNKKVEMYCYQLFIGDMCYALNQHIYDEWCSVEPFDNIIETENNVCAVVGETAYGDGCYYDNEGNSFPVDAGIIGVTNGNFFDEKANTEDLKTCGVIVEIPSGHASVEFIADVGFFTIRIDDLEANKSLYYGNIDTDEEYEEEEYEEDYEDHYEDEE